MKRSRQYRQLQDALAGATTVTITDAVQLIQTHLREGASVRLAAGLSPVHRSGARVQGIAPLSAPRPVRVAVLGPGAELLSALPGVVIAGSGAAAADEVIAGGAGLEAIIAHPSEMVHLQRGAKVLGPRGLMPSVAAGTLGTELRSLLERRLGGSAFRADRDGNVSVTVGVSNQPASELVAACESALGEIRSAAADVGQRVGNLTLSGSGGPGIPLRVS